MPAASEIPPPPRTPSGVEVRGSGLRVLIPSALLIAAVTALSNVAATQCSGPHGALPDDTRRDIADIRREVRDLATGQKALLDRVERESQAAGNARALDGIRAAAQEERLRAVERSRL